MRPHGSPAQLEARRRRGMELFEEGFSLNEVGRQLRCAASSVMRWRDALAAGGEESLKAKPAAGRPARLTKRQRKQLVACLLKGAIAHGYRTELWTTQRIADLIDEKFGIRYHRNHVGKLLHALGWSAQKPERRSLERDEAVIEEWKQRDWPRVKKTLHGWAPTSYLPTNRGSN